VDWQLYSLLYRQVFVEGYRYLDTCGSFMLEACGAFDLLSVEAKPTGAQLALPEKSLRVNVDVNGLEVFQEMPIDESDTFLDICSGLAKLAATSFSPVRVEESMFEMKFLVPMSTAKEAELAMLRLPGETTEPLARAFDMVPHGRRVNSTFVSGSLRLVVAVQPIAFETVRVHRHNPVIGATPKQTNRAKRLSAQADRVPQFAPFAIFLEVSLTEQEPPLENERKLFKVICQKAEAAKSFYSLK
jgi:hypothetical protein